MLFIFISFFDEISLRKQNTPDGTPRSVASHLGLCCLPIFNKMDAGLNELNTVDPFQTLNTRKYTSKTFAFLSLNFPQAKKENN